MVARVIRSLVSAPGPARRLASAVGPLSRGPRQHRRQGGGGRRLAFRILTGIVVAFVVLLVLVAIFGSKKKTSQALRTATSSTVHSVTILAARSTAPPKATAPPFSSRSTAPPTTLGRPALTQPPPTPAPTGAPTAPAPTVTVDLCGAPQNPYGYNLCGRGSMIYNPQPDVCTYFNCIASFAKRDWLHGRVHRRDVQHVRWPPGRVLRPRGRAQGGVQRAER